MPPIKDSDVRSVVEDIFTVVAEPWNRGRPDEEAYTIDNIRQKRLDEAALNFKGAGRVQQDLAATRIINQVVDVLKHRNDSIHPTFYSWYNGARESSELIGRFHTEEKFRAACEKWFGLKQVDIPEDEISAPAPEYKAPNKAPETYDFPEGWEREDADLHIGPHAVKLPGPEAIHVYEDFGIAGAGSLRTDSDPVWRTPKSRVSIAIDTIYSGAEHINKRFRPLLAYLRASPLTILKSDLLNKTMLREIQDETLFRRLVELRRLHNNNKDKIKELLTEYGLGDDWKSLNDLTTALTTETEIGRAVKKAAEIYQPAPEEGTIPGPLPQVPVMCTGVEIQSMSEAEHTFRVRYTFVFVNDLAVSADGLRFLDKNGDETDLPWEAAWLKRYVEMAHLDESKDIYMEEYDDTLPPLRMHYNGDEVAPDLDDIIADDRSIIVESLVAGYNNKVVPVDLLGQAIPSAQYLGRTNATVEILLDCDLAGIEKLTRLKTAIEHRTHSVVKDERDDSVIVDVPLINCMGHTNFIINKMQTATRDEATGRYRVVLSMIENRVKIANRETLVLNNRLMTKTVAKSLWDHMWEIWDAEQTDQLPDQKRHQFEYVRRQFFGDPNNPLVNCLINTDVIRATTWTTKDLTEYLSYYNIWDQKYGTRQGISIGYKGPEKDLSDYFYFQPPIPGQVVTARRTKNNHSTLKSALAPILLTPIGYAISGPVDYEPDEWDVKISYTEARTDEEWQKLKRDAQAKADTKRRETFNSWRWIMNTEEEDDLGPSRHRETLYDNLIGQQVVQQRLRDRFFEAIWDRISPDSYSGRSLEKMLWTARKERYGRYRDVRVLAPARPGGGPSFNNPDVAPMYGGAASPYTVGSRDGYYVTQEYVSDEAEYAKRKKEWENENPYKDIDKDASLWSKARVEDSYRTLYMMATMYSNLFPEWTINGEDPARYLDSKVGIQVSRDGKTGPVRDISSLSCYPDFELPTYRQLFTINGKLNPVWMKFAPTASMLGIPKATIDRVVKNGDGEVLGVTPDTLVEPTFYYATGRYKRANEVMVQEMLANEAIFHATADNNVFLETDLSFDSFNQRFQKESGKGLSEDGHIVKHLHEYVDELLSSKDENTRRKNKRAKDIFARLRDPDNDEPVPIRLTTTDNVVIATVRRNKDDKTGRGYDIIPARGKGRAIHYIDGSPGYDIKDPAQVRKNIEEAVDRIPEDKQDVRRCFPTFRFRIIDFDTGIYTDEFYDYNAVRSIHIFHDKYMASTLEMEIMNVTGVLDEDRFFLDGELEELGMPGDDEPQTEIDERAGRYFKAIKLKEGTAVQVLLGYSPDPEMLEVAFTGRISQVQVGDVVKIVASGYKTELQNEVTFQKNEGSWLDIVRKVFQYLDGEGALEEDETKPPDERKNGTPHLGTRLDGATTEQRREYNRIMRRLFNRHDLIHGSGAAKHADTQIPELTLDGRGYWDLFTAKPPRLRNVYLKTFVEDRKDYWTSTYEPGFDVLSELVRYMPGWICEVVPFDHLATLYIGPPEGEYFWTTRFQKQIVNAYRRRSQSRDLNEQRTRTLKMMSRFADYWAKFKKENGVDDEALPVEWRRSSIAGFVNDIKTKSAPVYNAFVGAFFGFDLLTKQDYHYSISMQLRHIIDLMVKSDKRREASAWKINIGSTENADINIHWRDTVERSIEYYTESTPGFKSKMRHLSHFPDTRIQEVVGRLAFGLDSPWERKTIEVEDLAGVTQAERVQAESSVSARYLVSQNDDIISNIWTDKDNRSMKQYLEDEQGLKYEVVGWDPQPLRVGDFIPIYNTYSILRRIDFNRDYYSIPMYPPRSFEENFGKLLSRSPQVFRVYLYALHEWMNKEVEDEDIAQMGQDLADFSAAYATPDRRSFRQFHHVTSRYDILSNNIVASMKEMSNTVLIRHPDGQPEYDTIESPDGEIPTGYVLDQGEGQWKAFKSANGVPFHPDLKLSQKKLAIAVEKNATTEELAAFTFFSRMGEALRPMYRGNLIVWGKVVKPHDVVIIGDDYNEMRGPIEVERVIHHFTAQGGWTTTIVPHAFVHVDNAIEQFQISVLQQILGAAEIFLDVVDWASLVISILTGGGGLIVKGAVAGIKKGFQAAASAAVKKAARKTIVREARRRGRHVLTKKAGRVVLTEVGQKVVGERAARRAAGKTGQAFAKDLEAELAKKVVDRSSQKIAKEAGLTIKGFLRSMVTESVIWGGAYAGRTGISIYNNHLAISAMESIPGMVSITPLIFEGRPLVAGIDFDDQYYITQAEAMWKPFTDSLRRFKDHVNNRAQEILGIGDEDDENPAYSAPAVQEGY